MTRLHLVRHAAATDEDGDAGLSPLGVAQSRLLADRLRAAGTVQVRHSPRRRAVETAEVLGEVLRTQTAADPRLDDRTPVPAPGEETLYPDSLRAWFGTVPAAERDEGGVQLSAAVEAYLADDRQLVLVTHAFVVAWFVQHVLGAPVSAWTAILATNAGLTTIDRRPADRHNWSALTTSGTSTRSLGDSETQRPGGRKVRRDPVIPPSR